MTNGKKKLGKRFHNDVRRAHRKSGPGTSVKHVTGPGRRHK